MFCIECLEIIGQNQNLCDVATALENHTLGGYTKFRHLKHIRKNVTVDIEWCLIRHI